ncbi:MAG: FMN-binding glutamate synthase family protein [Gammaproteobacteria bacterium]
MLVARYTTYLLVLLSALFIWLGFTYNPHFYWPLLAVLPLALLGVWDMVQTRHSILRNYPIFGHLRFLFEQARPEFRQYFFESETSGRPFNREQRSLVYERAKDTIDKMPFGTQLDVYSENYAWLNHSTVPKPKAEEPFRIIIGGPQCSKPYSASVYNISAMSFGAISANAIRALNKGAKLGNFAHDTGEGSISRYHRENGGDLIWELGTGYFGCRHDDGSFDPNMFADQATDDQIKMVEIKLSQGAKPGHGGILPGAKVTPEIAEARKVPIGVDCISPSAHSAFSTPLEMMQFIAKLRELSGGKPVGFKLCIGHRWEFLAICKAMLETEILPDFIVVDGAEGGTGAAPVEFSDHLGSPLRVGLNFVRNALVGTGLRDKIKLGASGKIVSAFDIAWTMTIGADWCNSARGFMFAVGCVQSRTCHTNRCPVGVATQDLRRQRGLVVSDKAERVYHFHRNTVNALVELLAAIGLEQPSDLDPCHFFIRQDSKTFLPASKAFKWLEPNELLEGTTHPQFAEDWAMADASTFDPIRAA